MSCYVRHRSMVVRSKRATSGCRGQGEAAWVQVQVEPQALAAELAAGRCRQRQLAVQQLGMQLQPAQMQVPEIAIKRQLVRVSSSLKQPRARASATRGSANLQLRSLRPCAFLFCGQPANSCTAHKHVNDLTSHTTAAPLYSTAAALHPENIPLPRAKTCRPWCLVEASQPQIHPCRQTNHLAAKKHQYW